jgi:hypothetical protein
MSSQTEKQKLWVVYLTSMDDTLDKTMVTAFKSQEEAFDCMFKSDADSANCTEMIIGSPSEGLRYRRKGQEIWLLEWNGTELALMAMKEKENKDKILADKNILDVELKENLLRIAILRSLLNLEATQKGDKSSFGETILQHSEYRPTSHYTQNLKPGTYHQTILNDLVEVQDLNRKLASWIQDLLTLTAYKGTATSLAEKSKWYNRYDPTIKFPANLEALRTAGDL